MVLVLILLGVTGLVVIGLLVGSRALMRSVAAFEDRGE